MSRGTKLWQAAGSPIIQGRSRSERPYWRQAVVALALACLLAAAGHALLSSPHELTSVVFFGFVRAVASAVVLSTVPCLIIVGLGRVMGWPAVSLLAGIVGGAVSVVSFASGWMLF